MRKPEGRRIWAILASADQTNGLELVVWRCIADASGGTLDGLDVRIISTFDYILECSRVGGRAEQAANLKIKDDICTISNLGCA